MTRTRAIVAALLASSLVVMGVLDRDREAEPTGSFGRADVSPMPVTDPADVLASTWFCAAGTARAGGAANLTVVIANASERRATGTVTWYPVGGGPVSTPVDVPASGSVTLAAVDALQADAVSAIVDVRGGGIAVEHTVSGARGASVAPCAPDASPTWYFANGTTERDAVEVLAVFNPFAEDAIVDITFATDEGRVEPGALSGLPIAASSTLLVDVHDHVRRRAVTATALVARSGRVVVDRVQSFDGSLGRRGVSLALGAPTLAESWTFPEGYWSEGFIEQWHVFNPGDVEAQVTLEVTPSQGDPVEPIDLVVPAQTQVVVDAAATERIPARVGHTSTVRSLNGVPVVAERTVDARAGSPRRGWASALGSPLTADRWVLAFGEASGNTDEWVVVHNPNVEAVAVSITALAGGQLLAVSGLQDLPIGPGERIGLRLGDHIRRYPLPILVTANGAVVVERGIYAAARGAVGISTVMGIPVT